MTTVTEEQRMQMKAVAERNRARIGTQRDFEAATANIITLCDALAAAEAKCREQEKDIERLRVSLDHHGRLADARNTVIKATEAQLAAANERIAKIEARLEIDHHYVMAPEGDPGEGGTGLVRVQGPIPGVDPDAWDGIECRDATIKLLEDRLKALATKEQS